MPVTREEARRIIHTAFYSIVRQAEPMAFDQFYDSTITSTVPKGRSPSGWDGFWWEAIASEIQSGMITRKAYVQNFNGTWLEQNKDEKWEEVLDHVGRNIGPLT